MTNRVKVFKLTDPIIQSVFFVVLALNIEHGNKYRPILFCIILWQFVSSIANFFIQSRTSLKTQRLIYFIILVVVQLVLYFFKGDIRSRFFYNAIHHENADLVLYQVVILIIEAVIAFWYYIICFREVHQILKKKKKKHDNDSF